LGYGTAVRVVTALLAAVGCAKSGRDVLPSAIVVVKDARNLFSGRSDDNPSRLSVSYTAPVPYPATGFLAEVRQRLEASDWKPLAEAWYDPRRPSSREVGWRSHVLRPPGQSGEFFNWDAQWSNPAGDVIVYMLQYQSGLPRSGEEGLKPDNDNLRVNAFLMPNRLVPVQTLPSSLILLDGARDVRAWRDRSRWRGLEYEMNLRYTVAVRYPPSEVISNLSERLGQQGWVPWLRPIAPPPFKPGWNFRAFIERLPTQQLFRWEADWQNQAGDSLRYDLSYDSALSAPGVEASKPDNDDLHIKATMLSKTAI
jgi:hypothetical protein